MNTRLLRSSLGHALVIASLCAAPAAARGQDPGEAGRAVRDALTKLDHAHPDWKARMEALVALAKVGPAAAPLLEDAMKADTTSFPARDVAAQALPLLRNKEPVRKALAAYDVAKIGTARANRPAPDCRVEDAEGNPFRLADVRGEHVVLVFLAEWEG